MWRVAVNIPKINFRFQNLHLIIFKKWTFSFVTAFVRKLLGIYLALTWISSVEIMIDILKCFYVMQDNYWWRYLQNFFNGPHAMSWNHIYWFCAMTWSGQLSTSVGTDHFKSPELCCLLSVTWQSNDLGYEVDWCSWGVCTCNCSSDLIRQIDDYNLL